MKTKSAVLLLSLTLLAAGTGSAAMAAAPASASTPAEARVKKQNEVPAAPLPRVEVAVVKRLTKVEQGLPTTSTLECLEEVILNPKVTGRIEKIYATKGDLVETGDLLMHLDDESEKATYASLEAQVAVSKAELAQSKVTLADAKRELDRYTRLRQSGYATAQEFDTRSTTYDSAVASNAKSAAEVKQAQANLDAQAVQVKEFELHAPIKGIILDDYDFTLGALVSATTNVYRIGRVDKLKARVDIAERDMGRLRLGMDAVLTFESLNGQTFYGTVTLIDPYINTSTRTIGAEITVDNQATDFKLRPGNFARVLLVETSEENPLAIPSEALRSDGTVMVIRDGKAELQKVTLGAAASGLVTVSEGLNVGEIVVTSGGNNVKAGDEVNFVITQE